MIEIKISNVANVDPRHLQQLGQLLIDMSKTEAIEENVPDLTTLELLGNQKVIIAEASFSTGGGGGQPPVKSDDTKDAAGESWNPALHSRVKRKTKDGLWYRLKPSISEVQLPTPTVLPPMPPIIETHIEIVAPQQATYEELMSYLTTNMSLGKINPPTIQSILEPLQVTLPELQQRPDLIPRVLAAAQTIVLNGSK